MALFFIINILLFITITVYKPYYLTKYFHYSFINPITIMFVVSLPVIIFTVFFGPLIALDESLFDPYYQYALYVTNISIFLELLVMIFLLKYLKKKPSVLNLVNRIRHFTLKRNRMTIIGIIFLFLFIISFVLLTKDTLGVIGWISKPRVGYQFHREGKGHFFAACISFLSLSYVFSTFAIKRNSTLIFTSFFFIILIFFMGSKGFVLQFTIYFIILLWLRKYRHFKLIIMLCIPFVFGFMLLNFFSSAQFDFEAIFRYFDYYANSAMYYKAYLNGKIELFLGKIFITSFWGLIPRALYPDKPFVYGFLYVNEIFYPGAAEASHTPAFGGPIGIFADFGLLGVIIFSIINIKVIVETILYFLLYKNLNINTIRSNSNLLYLFVWLLSPALFSFILFPMNLFLFLIIILFISFTARIKLI